MRPVHIPQEQVNDESVLLVDWLVPDGELVKAGQPIAVIETSKATTQIEAPEAGLLKHGVAKGQEVDVGAVFCHIGSEAKPGLDVSTPQNGEAEKLNSSSDSQEPAVQKPAEVLSSSETPAAMNSVRFSRRALELIQENKLSKDLFRNKGLVRETDVLAMLSAKQAPPDEHLPNTARGSSMPRPGPIPAAGVATRKQELPRMKRVEARYLASGRENTLPSVVTVLCKTSGLKAALESQAGSAANTSAVFVYETARLLRKHSVFNAFHEDGKVCYYESVNIGLAIDAGHGLKVPVVNDADKKQIKELSVEIEDFVLSYLDDKIPVASLAGGTFTITDLSGEDVLTFHPLINQGQAAILGVGAEFFPPGSREGFFHLILAFDHQLTEGRAAAQFLKELRDRIHSYEEALRPGGHDANEQARCSRCSRTISELESDNEPLLESLKASGQRALICRRCLVQS